MVFHGRYVLSIPYTFIYQSPTDFLVKAIVDHISWDGSDGHYVFFATHISRRHCRRLHILCPALGRFFYLDVRGIFDPTDVPQGFGEDNGLC